MKHQEVLDYLISIDFENPAKSATTWNELGQKFGMKGEAVRSIWRRYGNMKPRSSWQVQVKGGDVKWLHSYRHGESEISEDDIRDVITSIKDIQPTYFNDTKFSKKPVCVVFTSDKHIGAMGTDKNPYDRDKIMSRTNQLTEHISKLADVFGGFSLLSVVDLGDSTDGYKGKTDRQSHDLEQSMNDREIFEVFMEAHTKLFKDIASIGKFNKVEFHGLANSNHASTIDYMCFRTLQYYADYAFPDLDFNIYTEHENVANIGGTQYILMHGKDSQYMKQHFPLVTNDKTKSHFKGFMLKNGVRPGCRIIKGDLHTACSETTELFQYRNIGSMFGSSNYIKYNFGDSLPSVGFDIIMDDVIFESTLLLK